VIAANRDSLAAASRSPGRAGVAEGVVMAAIVTSGSRSAQKSGSARGNPMGA
jgi:hypothetical protein